MLQRILAFFRSLGQRISAAYATFVNTTRRFVALLLVIGGLLLLLLTHPFLVLNLVLMIPVGVLALGLFLYALAHVDIFTTLMREGTHGVIMKGKSIDHVILRHLGYWINDPRRTDPNDSQHFDPKKPKWERIKGETGEFYSSYPPDRWVARRLERLGIYPYGFWPFKNRYSYSLDWVETQISKETQKEELRPRKEGTDFAYSAMFTYAIRLVGAETKNNIPVNAFYLLSIEVNNAATALFNVEDWLTRITADSNTKAKIWFANAEYEQVTREGLAQNQTVQSEFAKTILSLNNALIDDRAPAKGKTQRGAPVKLGVTIVGVSLQQVEPGGPDAANLARALAAEVVAERTGRGTVATAKANAEAVTIAAEAEQKAIDKVYTEIQRHTQGVEIRTLQAIEKSGEKGGNTVWPIPLDRLGNTLGRALQKMSGPQQPRGRT